MKKILYITTVSRTINAFLVPHIERLKKEGHIVDCACCVDKKVDKNLVNLGVRVFNIPFTRNPLDLKNIKAFNELVKIQNKNEYEMVHVHTPIAALYGRLLKIKFPKLKTIYTVHGFHFHKGAPILNWGIYYPIEKTMSKLTDAMITMNSEDYERANDFGIKKAYKVNGVGIDLDLYNVELLNRYEIRMKLNLKKNDFVMLMIAEVNKNKNHKQMIQAVEILKKRGVNIKVICAGEGLLFERIQKEIKYRKLDESIQMLGFRTDIKDLIAACDLGILMSYREGLPRNIMELMACKKAVIGTNIRGIRDLVKEGVNGYLVSVGDAAETAEKIEMMYNNRELLEELSYNAFDMIQKYDVNKVVMQLEEVYV